MVLALDLDDAHPAGAEARQLGLVAQGRDLDPVVAADLEDRLALEALDDAPVDLDPDPRACSAGAAGDWVVISRSASVSSWGVTVSSDAGVSGRDSRRALGRRLRGG